MVPSWNIASRSRYSNTSCPQQECLGKNPERIFVVPCFVLRSRAHCGVVEEKSRNTTTDTVKTLFGKRVFTVSVAMWRCGRKTSVYSREDESGVDESGLMIDVRVRRHFIIS